MIVVDIEDDRRLATRALDLGDDASSRTDVEAMPFGTGASRGRTGALVQVLHVDRAHPVGLAQYALLVGVVLDSPEVTAEAISGREASGLVKGRVADVEIEAGIRVPVEDLVAESGACQRK